MGRAVDMDSGKHGTVREMNALLDQLARQTEFVDVEDRSAPTKASLCARALVAGCPDAFINFHYLTTTGDGVGDDNPTEEELLARLVDPASYEEKEEVSAEHMPFVLESLVAAETHARSGDPAKTQDAYRALARFFIDTDNPMKAIFFHQKCLDAAVASGRAEDEMESNRALGETLESARNLADAVAAYERRLDAATRAEKMGTATADDIADARACLSRAYYAAAEWRGSEGDADGSVAFLERCLAVSEAERREGDAGSGLGVDASASASASAASHKLGLACHAAGNHARAAELQRAYLRACEIRGDDEGEGAARRALAEALLAAGDSEDAAAELRRFVDTSEANGGDVVARARACCGLGKIRVAAGEHEDAVRWFERFYELAERCDDGRLRDVARVNLGVARGLARADGLMRHVAESADAPTPELLKWRSSRENFGYAV